MLSNKALSDFVTAVQNLITSYDQTLDVNIGPLLGIVVTPPATLANNLYAQIVHLNAIMDIANWQQASDDELDAIVNTYGNGMTRLGATYSTGVVTFGTHVRPVADIVIPAGTAVGTGTNAQGQQVIFVTTEQVVMSYSSVSSYYNPINNGYEIDVPIVAVSSGSQGTVAPNQINVMLKSIAGISYVYNKAGTSPAQDRETSQALVTRLLAINTGYSDDVYAGLYFDLLTNAGVSGCAIVGKDDPLLTRVGSDTGAVDVYVIDTAPTSTQEYFIFNGTNYVFMNQPVISVVSVFDSNGNDVTSKFNFVKDTGIYSGSVRAQDKINYVGSGLTVGQLLVATINYDSEESSLQNYFSSKSKEVFGRDILIRQAIGNQLFISAHIVVQSSYDFATVQSLVYSAIFNYINGLKLGEDAIMAQAIALAEDIPGMENIYFSDFRLLTEASGTVHDIVITKNMYNRIMAGNLIVGT
jgi:hypothetical protein